MLQKVNNPHIVTDVSDYEIFSPVLQIIGSEDETWGGGMPDKYRKRFHDFTQVILPDVGHKDALWKADRFLDVLAEYLRDEAA